MCQHIDLFLPSRDNVIRMDMESRDIVLSCPIFSRDIHITATAEHLPVAHRVKINLPVGVGISASPRIYKLAQAGIPHNIGVSANPKQEGE